MARHCKVGIFIRNH